MDDLEKRVEARLAAMLEECRAENIFMTGDGRVWPEDAAKLLGMKPKTLENRRSLGTSPPFYKIGAGRHRISYALSDLARWFEDQCLDRPKVWLKDDANYKKSPATSRNPP